MIPKGFFAFAILIGVVGAASVSYSSEETLLAHNKLRNLHVDTPLMTYDSTLAAKAEAWAGQLLMLGRLQNPLHALDEGYGWNLYRNSDSSAKLGNAVHSWYTEGTKCYYNYATASAGVTGCPIGHFTQVIWASSVKLGCGGASSQTGGLYVVCFYSPSGNIGGYEGLSNYIANVHRMKAGAQTPSIAELGGKDPCDAIAHICSLSVGCLYYPGQCSACGWC